MSKIKNKVGVTVRKKPARTKPACEKRIPQFFQESDSIRAKFMSCALGRRAAATLMKAKMDTTFTNLESVAKAQRWGNNISPVNFTFKQFRNYADSRKGKVSTRTIHNECSHIRRALIAVGREKFAKVECSRENLGVEKASRDGTAPAISEKTLSAALGNAGEDIRVLILLSKALGLRLREAVMSGDSLKVWKKALEKGNRIVIRDGTKGGRIREVVLCPQKAEEAKIAIFEALKLIKRQGSLVVSKTLKSALSSTQRRLKSLGLSGEESFHSLRRHFAVAQYFHYVNDLAMEEIKARGLVASDLGHSESRGKMAYSCYLKVTLEQLQALQKQQMQPAATIETFVEELT